MQITLARLSSQMLGPRFGFKLPITEVRIVNTRLTTREVWPIASRPTCSRSS